MDVFKIEEIKIYRSCEDRPDEWCGSILDKNGEVLDHTGGYTDFTALLTNLIEIINE